MPTAGLNVSVGIDAGSHTSKLAGDGKVIASFSGFDLLKLREEAEIYFDEPVFSCVIAVPDSFGIGQRGELNFTAKKSGFKNIEIIQQREAVSNALDSDSKILACDFGASKIEFMFFQDSEFVDGEIIEDVCGSEFDRIFAEWLRERFTLNLIKEKELLELAEKFKIELSQKEILTWRGVNIAREDFERLIYFPVKRASHTLERFIKCFNPERFIMTGSCAEIPLAKKIFSGLFPKTEFIKNLAALGASAKADSLSSARERRQRSDINAKLREIRGSLMSLEDLLTRKQKDRLYFLFRQAEGILPGNPALIKLLENLISEIRTADLKR